MKKFKKNKEVVTIYEPGQRLKINIFNSFFIFIKNIYYSRELFFQLFKREFFGLYKKSYLGIFSFFIDPLIGLISWSFMNFTGVLNPGDVGIPYPVYVLFSTSIWSLFKNIFDGASLSLESGSSFIMQVKFPHEILLINQVAQKLIYFCLPFLLNIVVLLLFGIIPNWKIVFFPLVIIPLILLGAALGLIVSIFSVVAKEVSKIIILGFGLLMYITPIIYSPDLDNEMLKAIIKWNPLTYLVGITRDMIIYGKIKNIDRYFYAAIFSFLVFFIIMRLFFVSEDRIIEKMI